MEQEVEMYKGSGEALSLMGEVITYRCAIGKDPCRK